MLGPARTNMISVGEPFQRSADRKWYFAIGLGGGKQSESRGYGTEDAAKREAGKLRAAAVAQQQAVNEDLLAAIGPPDGTLAWYAGAMDALAQQVTHGGGREARDNLKALAFAANARKALQDDKELRAEVVELREAVGEIRAARKHGSRTTGGSAGAPAIAGA
jgi:hypothetical protein